MLYHTIQLKDTFPQLAQSSGNPTLTIMLPDNMVDAGRGDAKHPCLLICPGGGYRHVSKRESEPIAMWFLSRGYNIFILNYSVPRHTFPTQLREVAAALELIHANADDWHCDLDKVAIIGFSAGGHLAAHYSNAYAWPEVREMFPESKPVNATLLCYPVISAGPCRHAGSFKMLLGKEEPTEEDIARFSCENMVTEQTPPTFLWHTRTDPTVPVMNSLLYAQALAVHNVPFSLHIYPFGDHGLSTVDSWCNEELEDRDMLAQDWFDAAFKWLSFTL